jgi:hypothetical protein
VIYWKKAKVPVWQDGFSLAKKLKKSLALLNCKSNRNSFASAHLFNVMKYDIK